MHIVQGCVNDGSDLSKEKFKYQRAPVFQLVTEEDIPATIVS